MHTYNTCIPQNTLFFSLFYMQKVNYTHLSVASGYPHGLVFLYKRPNIAGGRVWMAYSTTAIKLTGMTVPPVTNQPQRNCNCTVRLTRSLFLPTQAYSSSHFYTVRLVWFPGHMDWERRKRSWRNTRANSKTDVQQKRKALPATL